MRRTKIITAIVVGLTLAGCISGQQDCSLDAMNKIDSSAIKPSLKAIIYKYIKQHPNYKSYTIVSDVALAEPLSDESYWYFILSPSYQYDGEYKEVNIKCPANYFKLDNKIIFIASKADELTVDQKRVKIYNRYTDSMTTEKYINACWLIRIQKNIGLSEIVSTNVKNFVGIKQLKGTEFKAPVSDRRLKE